MTVHPTVQILAWSLSVLVVQRLSLLWLLCATALILWLALWLSSGKLRQLIKRTRWVMLSLWLIYAYTTPGHALWNALGLYSPTWEGLHDGLLQWLRLLASLASLAVLLDRLSRDQLISGLYTLFAPLVWLHISRERLAVRLALTLQYAEIALLKKYTWQELLHLLRNPQTHDARQIVLPRYPFTRLDTLLGLLMLLIFLGML